MRFDWFTKSRHPFIPAAVQVGGMMEQGPLSHPRPHPLMSGRQGRRGWRYLNPVPCRKGDFQWYPRSRQYGHWCPYCLWRGSTEDPSKDNQSHFTMSLVLFVRWDTRAAATAWRRMVPSSPRPLQVISVVSVPNIYIGTDYVSWRETCVSSSGVHIPKAVAPLGRLPVQSRVILFKWCTHLQRGWAVISTAKGYVLIWNGHYPCNERILLLRKPPPPRVMVVQSALRHPAKRCRNRKIYAKHSIYFF